MKLVIDKQAIDRNIRRAEELAGVPVSIMLKGFYDYIYTDEMKSRKVFSLSIEGSVCPSINEATRAHSAAVVASLREFEVYHIRKGFTYDTLYIPINAYDGREGICVGQAVKLAKAISSQGVFKLFAMITSGCISPAHPSISELEEWWKDSLSEVMDGITIGGSFYIGELYRHNSIVRAEVREIGGTVVERAYNKPPYCITDVRIGEYALFGTIPYNDDVALHGDNALTVQMEVIGVHRDRGQIVVKGGYSHIDTKNCSLLSGGLKFVNTSSDYTIYADPFKRYNVGDTVEVVPDYYSLVKLQHNVERVFI